jgi:pimeloyl-ACP methyl ester carboxylesterase
VAVLKTKSASIHYEVRGSGYPVLLLAPGGLRSSRRLWDAQPWNPSERLAGKYRLVTMDQRNAGESAAAPSAGDGWLTYANDQLAVLDEIGVGSCHVVGMCIGGPFILKLLDIAPERFSAAVAIQPSGEYGNRSAKQAAMSQWIEQARLGHPETPDAVWAEFARAMLGDGIFQSVPEDRVAAMSTPLLVLAGDDIYHPREVSVRLAALARNARLIESWREGAVLESASAAIEQFLAAHTPAELGS